MAGLLVAPGATVEPVAGLADTSFWEPLGWAPAACDPVGALLGAVLAPAVPAAEPLPPASPVLPAADDPLPDASPDDPAAPALLLPALLPALLPPSPAPAPALPPPPAPPPLVAHASPPTTASDARIAIAINHARDIE